jgi:hypothetical protein
VTHPKLQDWLAEQVAQTYDIPEQLARRWLQEEQLLPLLDGLDQMEVDARTACIAAINAYFSSGTVKKTVNRVAASDGVWVERGGKGLEEHLSFQNWRI